MSSTVQSLQIDTLWRDGLIKQISGFTLLGLAVLGLLMSLRKQWTRFKWGDFAYWRLMHAVLGVLILLVLLSHTGLNLGDNLNMALMLVFLGLAGVGGLAGGAIVVERRLSRSLGQRLRSWSTWLHIGLFWPLPALLSYHILSVYYF